MGEQSSHQNVASNGIKICVVDIPKLVRKSSKCMPSVDTHKDGDAPSQSYVTMFASEFVGTAILMFIGCMGCISNFDDPAPPHYFGGLAFGLTVMMIIQMFGHISGAHLNPAVTAATVIFGHVKPVMAVVYVVAQFLGATLGFGLLKILVSDDYAPEGFCLTTVNPKISVIQALGIEIVITTVLILVCCAVWDKRNADKPDSVPLRFGFVIAVISMGAGPLTGASMNTARSFAPLVFGGSWQDQWIYWVGPNVAPLLGCGLYKFLFGLPEEKQDTKSESVCLDENPNRLSEKV